MQSHHHQGAHYSFFLKLQLLKWPIIVHWCVINSVAMWLHIIVGTCWCVYVTLFGSSATYTHQQGPTNICSHIPTELTTHRYILIVYLTTVTLARRNNALPDGGVTAPKHVGVVLM